MSTCYQTHVDTITQHLYQRLETYPIRSPANTVQLNRALDSLVQQLQCEIAAVDFQPDQQVLARATAFIASPVFICGSMKSGTSLLTQLLDGHPDLLVMPGDSHYLKLSQRWTHSQFDEISSFWLKRLINPTGKKPYWFIGPDKDVIVAFLLYLRYFLQQRSHDPVACVVLSIFASGGLRSGYHPKRSWVAKTPDNELMVPQLLAHFPNAKFIHILRNPLTTIPSLKKLAEARNWQTSTVEFVFYLRRLFGTAIENRQRYGEDVYYLLRYRDLVADPERELAVLCNFLGIPFDRVLLEPTENSVTGMSNSLFSEQRVVGRIIQQASRRSYTEHLDETELKDVVNVLDHVVTPLGFDFQWEGADRYALSPLLRKVHVASAYVRMTIARIVRTLGRVNKKP